MLAIVEKDIGRDEADGGRLALNEVLQSQGLTTAPEAPAVTIGNGVKKQESNVPQPFSDRYGR